MNRRGFFGTLAAIAVTPLAPRDVWSRRSDMGGFTVPAEFIPAIKQLEVRGRLFVAPESRMFLSGSYRRVILRTIDGQTVTRESPIG